VFERSARISQAEYIESPLSIAQKRRIDDAAAKI
jgi:hypothetical protein